MPIRGRQKSGSKESRGRVLLYAKLSTNCVDLCLVTLYLGPTEAVI